MEAITPNKVLYTGSSGSIGSAMPLDAIALQTRLESSVESMKKEISKYQSSETFIHLAALASVPLCEEDPDLAYRLNVDGARKWFQAAAESGIKRFIYVSTSHVYAQSTEPLDTTSKLEPRNTYAETKLKGEEVLKEVSKKYPQCQLIIARVFSVLSKKMRPGFLLTELHRRAKEKDFSPIYGLNDKRDFLTSEIICQKLLELGFVDKPPHIVNICSGKGTKISALVEKVFKEYGIDKDSIVPEQRTYQNPTSIIGIPTKY